jgi:hypothetical protein
MSGLEVVALVVGIVSAFSGTASFLSELKKRKTKTKTRNKPEDLDKLRDAVKISPESDPNSLLETVSSPYLPSLLLQLY